MRTYLVKEFFMAMKTNDIIKFSWHALGGAPARTALMLLAMSIGVASVVLLTSLGEGARRYVVNEFSSLGTNLLIMFPGRSETTGTAPPIVGGTPRDLTLADALAIQHSRLVKRVAPIVVGAAPVSWSGLEREVTVLGTTSQLYEVRHLQLLRGHFLPEADPTRASPECVLGYNLYKELFRSTSPVGKWVRVYQYRCRVIGVLDKEGLSMGVDMGEVLIMPIASAQSLFNTESLFRVLIEAENPDVLPKAEKAVLSIIKLRHDGEDDVTVISQDALLATFDRILSALTYALGGIAAVSLLVAGIMIMNVMLVSVAQRTHEIGLLKALGAPQHNILVLFLVESAFLALIGAAIGLLLGMIGNEILQQNFESIEFVTPIWAIVASVVVSLGCGLGFGLLPARKAARLNPVTALAGN